MEMFKKWQKTKKQCFWQKLVGGVAFFRNLCYEWGKLLNFENIMGD